MLRSLSLLSFFTLAVGCRATVQHGLEERDANEVVSALASRAIEASKVQEKSKKALFAVEVAQAQATDAIRALDELRLPRAPRVLTRDAVTQTGLVESPGTERARLLEGVEGDLEQTLESLDGVASASVELALPLVAARAGQPTAPARASVLIRVRPEAQQRLTEQREALRGLVAGSVDGLHTEDVTLFLDVAMVRAVPVVPPAAPPRGLIWALLAAMLTFAAGFIGLLLRQVWSGAPAAPTAPAAGPATRAPVRVTIPRTFVRSPQRAA